MIGILSFLSGAAVCYAVTRVLLQQEVKGIVQQELERLRKDVAPPKALPEPAAPLAPAPAPAETEEAITPEVLAVLSAAVAAFLGKTARIRTVRRAAGQGSSPWAQQGRVFVQASHNLSVRRS